jgi:hypothetical protein
MLLSKFHDDLGKYRVKAWKLSISKPDKQRCHCRKDIFAQSVYFTIRYVYEPAEGHMRTRMAVLSSLMAGVSLLATAHAWATSLPASCGPNDVSFNVNTQKGGALSSASPDKATLVFVQRNSRCVGCSTTRVGVDGAWVGANKGNSYFAVAIDPGEHHVCANWGAPLARVESKIGLTELQVEAGKTYFFETAVVVPVANAEVGQGGAPGMILRQLSYDEGAFLVSRSQLAVALPKPK